jgi:hypothetical protein
MSRTQKVILAVLAFLDALVIAALGYVVVSTQSAMNTNVQEQTPDLCSVGLLNELSDIPSYHPSVANDQFSGELYVRLHVQSSAFTDADSRGAQSLWTALSVLAPDFTHLCPSAETLFLTVETVTPSGPEYHVARLPAHAVTDWVNGRLSDDQLATTSRYRYVRDHDDPSTQNQQD